MDLQKGDIIVDSHGLVREQVIARLENMIWTRVLEDDLMVGPPQGPTLIEALQSRGFRKEESND